jgi:hypothetical protein
LRVFISWSGERSKALAIAVRDWLPLVLHYVEPWLSDADIEAGERWAQSVAKELNASNFGIVCVTSENVNSPWILFEAGALTKSLETSRVIPLLFDLEFSDISGPLAQFQAKKLTRAGLDEVIHSLQGSADEPIPEERAKQLFEALWSEFENKLSEIPDEAPTERHVRPQHEVLEELVSSIRTLDARVRESEEMISTSPRGRRGSRGSMRFHPMMLRELDHFMADGPDDPIGILILASLFRDDAPWLYELAVEAYRAIVGNRRDRKRKVERLLRSLDMTMHGPFPMEELGMDPMTIDMIRHELPRYLDRYVTTAGPGASEDSDQ